MLSFQQAREIAENEIQKHLFKPDYEIVIVETGIMEKPYAWIFPYASKRRREGDINYALGGNSPIFVNKHNGQVSIFPSYLSVEGMIDAYEEKNQVWSLRISTGIYSDVKKLLALKGHLTLEQQDIVTLKAKNTEMVTTGSKTRLDRLAALLRTSDIGSEIVLTN